MKAPLPKPKGKLNNLDDIEKLKYEKVSYRQKGKQNSGQIIKGNVWNSYLNAGNPSVPSKFETQLFDSNKEKTGFGSKSLRFDGLNSEDPGPGSYATDDTLSLLGKTKASNSKKGYGNGFISKVERFSSDFDYKAYFLPGPGAYSSSLPSTRDDTESQVSFKRVKTMNKSKAGTSSFKGLGRIDNNKKNIVPGPGSYYAEKRLARSQSQAHPSSVFKSGVQKLHSIKPFTKNPPVGHYDVNNDIVLSKAESTFNILKNTSNFWGPLNWKRVKVDLYDPFKQIDDDKIKLPGPGAYEPHDTIVDNIKKKILKPSSYFVTKKGNGGRNSVVVLRPKNTKINSESDFEKSYKNRWSANYSNSYTTPGPGSYIEPLDKNKYLVAAVSSSMFKSDSLRDINNLGNHRGPGPAFYKVKSVANKRSHNYNPKRKWL